jgi:hypothetical protein
MIATQLSPLVKDFVSNAQSTFVKRWRIHDNFMSCTILLEDFTTSKILTLLFKLDICKALDSVRLDFILELLKRHVFPPKFCERISELICSSSSRVLLNGLVSSHIKHGRGLR